VERLTVAVSVKTYPDAGALVAATGDRLAATIFAAVAGAR